MELLPGNCGVVNLFERTAKHFSCLSLKQPTSSLRRCSPPVAFLPSPTRTRRNKLFLIGNSGVDNLFKRNANHFSCLSLKELASSARFRPLPVASLPTPTGTSSTKLFVTGLSIYTTERSLQNAFSSCGKVVGVKIIMDSYTKKSKGFGFVEYSTEEEASTALKEMNGKIINSRAIIVDIAKPASRSGRTPEAPQSTPGMNKEVTAEAVEDLRNL